MNDDDKRAKTRERVRRYRERKAAVTDVTNTVVTVNEQFVTPQSVKMICKCQFFNFIDGQLVCSQCGRPAPKKAPGDKVRRGIELKR